jgi:hypothetical protein
MRDARETKPRAKAGDEGSRLAGLVHLGGGIGAEGKCVRWAFPEKTEVKTVTNKNDELDDGRQEELIALSLMLFIERTGAAGNQTELLLFRDHRAHG